MDLFYPCNLNKVDWSLFLGNKSVDEGVQLHYKYTRQFVVFIILLNLMIFCCNKHGKTVTTHLMFTANYDAIMEK